MSYLHRGGPSDGTLAQEIAEGYSPVAARAHESGEHRHITQDVIWKDARITKARFGLEGAEYEAEVGSGIRTIRDNKGRPASTVGRQEVLLISSAGYIFVEPGAEWGTPEDPRFSRVDISNLKVLDFVDSQPTSEDGG
ncbi:hypothetical protein [Microbacterium sp. NPDC090003]|uniref:hypothetical protein n=1 Tax=Microbacterium sp. NPDC090003 TaxID=3364203 RepID=UPI00381E1861